MEHKKHYKEDYFKWQGAIGEFGGWANIGKFRDYISENQTVIDFGSGGGYLLKNIDSKVKIGIEINESGRDNAMKIGIDCVASTALLEDNFADLIISNNVLEHVTHPLSELQELKRVLKPGGKIIFVVPCESINYKYRPNDINYHLHSWSPMCLGNLFNEAGFKVLESKAYKHKWPPFYKEISKIFGRRVFNFVCRIYARIETSWFQVRVIAEKR